MIAEEEAERKAKVEEMGENNDAQDDGENTHCQGRSKSRT